jgi:hypothetical protein
VRPVLALHLNQCAGRDLLHNHVAAIRRDAAGHAQILALHFVQVKAERWREVARNLLIPDDAGVVGVKGDRDMAWMKDLEASSTEGIRRDSAPRGVVGDRISRLLLVAIALSSLYGVFGNGSPAQSANAPPEGAVPVQSIQVARARDGAMAAACRTVRWCSKPIPTSPAMRWIA